MKLIPKSKITKVTATSENTNYPASNVMDEHPKKLWKTNGNKDYAKLTCDIESGMNGVAMFNITADKVIVSIKDPNSISWDTTYQAASGSSPWGIKWDTTYQAAGTSATSGISWSAGPTEQARNYTLSDFANTGSLFVEFEKFNIPVEVSIQFYGTGSSVLSLGVLVIGDILNVGTNPDYGITQSFEDYGIIKELNNGSYYYKQRDIVRTLSGRLTVVDDINTLYKMSNIPKLYGSKPMAWLLTSTNTDYDNNFVIYGRLSDMPSSNFESLNINRIDFSIKEVI